MGHLRLRVGVSPAGAIVVVIVGSLFVVGFGTIFVAFAMPEVFPELFGWTYKHHSQMIRNVPVQIRLALIAVALIGVVGVALLVLHSLRYAFFLEGTQLIARRMFSSDVVDLARASRFWFDDRQQHHTQTRGSFEYSTTYIVPLLCVRGPRCVVKIPLAHYGRRLPREQLEALAWAISAGDRQRGPHGGEARHAVEALQRFAHSLSGEHFNLVANQSRRMRSD